MQRLVPKARLLGYALGEQAEIVAGGEDLPDDDERREDERADGDPTEVTGER